MLELTLSAHTEGSTRKIGLTRVDSQNPSISLTRLLTNETWSRVSLHINLWYRYCFLIASTLVSLGTPKSWREVTYRYPILLGVHQKFLNVNFHPFQIGMSKQQKHLRTETSSAGLVWLWDILTVYFADESWLYRANSYLMHLEQQVTREQIMAEVFKARRWTITSSKLCRFKMQARLAWGRKYIN